MPETILRYEDALATVLAHAASVQPRGDEAVPLLDAAGRTLAEPVHADRDQPPFDRSTRDGFAVRAADCQPDTRLRRIGLVRAGEFWQGAPLAAGEALEIMTGAPLPAGADAVLMVEHAVVEADRLTPDRTLRAGENVVPRGAEARSGLTVLPRGHRIDAAAIAVAASCGAATLRVFARPSVAILPTGDELVEVAETPAAHQIRNSNSYALAAMVAAEGTTPHRLAVARDTLEDLRARIHEGLQHDLLVLTGGVSMGKYDFVEQALSELGAELLFTGARIQPGKPVVFGRIPRLDAPGTYTYLFGLPGNPISTQVCFHLFVAPLLRALAGRTELAPRFVEARLREHVRGGASVTRFLPAELTSDWQHASVRLTGWQGSGDLAANARGNSYCVLPAEVEHFAAGDTVRVLLR
jgi:molybdopterin molybdotransferase